MDRTHHRRLHIAAASPLDGLGRGQLLARRTGVEVEVEGAGGQAGTDRLGCGQVLRGGHGAYYQLGAPDCVGRAPRSAHGVTPKRAGREAVGISEGDVPCGKVGDAGPRQVLRQDLADLAEADHGDVGDHLRPSQTDAGT